MTETPWYQQVFNEDYLLRYTPFLTPERTAAETDALVRLLDLPENASVLDLCCGHGRHSIALARRGYRVTGQDLSEVFLTRARADAGAASADVCWVHSDMREIPFECEFDAAFNMFTAFGYLESDAEDLRVLREVRKALKPGGRFLLETLHRDGLLRRFESCGVQRHEDGVLVLEERRLDLLTGRQEVDGTPIHPDGTRAAFHYSLRLYTALELVRQFEAAGLKVEAVYGGLDGSPLTLDSRRLVLIGSREGV